MQRLEYIIKLELREFLNELLRIKKERNVQFSQRSYAHRLGFTTSTFNELLKGKRKITKKSVEKLLSGLSQDRDVEECLKAWPQNPKWWGTIPEDHKQEAFSQLVKLSNVAGFSVGKEDLFCVLIVAKNQADFEYLHQKIAHTMKENCDVQDLYEIKVAYV